MKKYECERCGKVTKYIHICEKYDGTGQNEICCCKCGRKQYGGTPPLLDLIKVIACIGFFVILFICISIVGG